MPTPALAFLAGTGDFAAGIMVSASHNPADDNGLKVLDQHGLKLDDGVEDEIEQLIWRTEELGSVGNAEIGRSVVDPGARSSATASTGSGLAADVAAGGLRIVLDCANGSGGVVGPEILAATGAHGRGDPQRARRDQHQRRLRRDGTGVARGGGRASAAPTSGSRSTATPTG